MVVITGSEIFSSTWNLLYVLISGNIVDPQARGTKFIYSAFPDPQKASFNGFPIVIINPVETPSTVNISLRHGAQKAIVSSQIDVFSKKAIDLDVLTDDIHDALLTKQADLTASGLTDMSISSAGTGTDILNDSTKVHFKSFVVNMDFYK